MTMTTTGDTTPTNSNDVAADARDPALRLSVGYILTRALAATTAAGVFDRVTPSKNNK